MNNREFKTIIGKAFTSNGFKIVSKRYRHDGTAASILVDLQKYDFGERYFVNVGFWLRALGDNVPVKVEHTHMYYRLESLFPSRRDAVLEGGELSHPEQPYPANRLAALIQEECIPTLVALADSIDCLKRKFDAGELKSGLVRKEAREFLTKG